MRYLRGYFKPIKRAGKGLPTHPGQCGVEPITFFARDLVNVSGPTLTIDLKGAPRVSAGVKDPAGHSRLAAIGAGHYPLFAHLHRQKWRHTPFARLAAQGSQECHPATSGQPAPQPSPGSPMCRSVYDGDGAYECPPSGVIQRLGVHARDFSPGREINQHSTPATTATPMAEGHEPMTSPSG